MFTILLFGKAWEINERLKDEDDGKVASVAFIAFLFLIFVWPLVAARLLFHAGASKKAALLLTVIPGVVFALLSIGLYLAVGFLVSLTTIITATAVMAWDD